MTSSPLRESGRRASRARRPHPGAMARTTTARPTPTASSTRTTTRTAWPKTTPTVPRATRSGWCSRSVNRRPARPRAQGRREGREVSSYAWFLGVRWVLLRPAGGIPRNAMVLSGTDPPLSAAGSVAGPCQGAGGVEPSRDRVDDPPHGLACLVISPSRPSLRALSGRSHPLSMLKPTGLPDPEGHGRRRSRTQR